MTTHTLKIEEELRTAVIDRLIAASLNDGRSAREATLERWRNLTGSKAASKAMQIPVSLV
jgi:hypothetical protein